MNTMRTGSAAALDQLPSSLQQLIAFERFHLHKIDKFQARDARFDVRYFPQNCDAFRLPCFWVGRKHLYVYGGQRATHPEPQMLEGLGLDQNVLFPVHPLALDHYGPYLARVGARAADNLFMWAVPTASTRTLLAWPDREPDKAFFLKVSLPYSICGDRRLPVHKLACAIGLSLLVEESLPLLPRSLGFLPESFGFVPRQMLDSGVIVRSIPAAARDGRIILAPLFALFGGDDRCRPLLLTMLERTRVDGDEFVERVLCADFAQLWVVLALRFGLILEAHAQDLMLELSPDLTPSGRLFYRDFEGLQVDWDLRRQRGWPTPACMPRAHSWHETYATSGFPHGGVTSHKLKISLLQYLDLVLRELDEVMAIWRRRGLLPASRLREGDVLTLFRYQLLHSVELLFDVRPPAACRVRGSATQLACFLLGVRRKIIAKTAPTRSARTFQSPAIVAADA